MIALVPKNAQLLSFLGMLCSCLCTHGVPASRLPLSLLPVTELARSHRIYVLDFISCCNAIFFVLVAAVAGLGKRFVSAGCRYDITCSSGEGLQLIFTFASDSTGGEKRERVVFIGDETLKACVVLKASDRSDGVCNPRGERIVRTNDEVSEQISPEGIRMPCLWPARCVYVSARGCARLAFMCVCVSRDHRSREQFVHFT